jgi:hypothetical protein
LTWSAIFMMGGTCVSTESCDIIRWWIISFVF